MKIVITGASGLVGTHLAHHLAAKHQVLPLTHADLDITERGSVRRLILNERPALIINCAVVSVDECERNPALAQAVNVAGPQALAETAAELEAEFLHFSTNYVFDGVREGQVPYTIDDEPYPINVYGMTKLAGERAVRAAASKCFIVRTSWVYGAGKDSFLGTVHRHLLAGKQVRAITDVWASTTYVDDLVVRTEELLTRRHYATYHVVNSGVCSYEEFARLSARLVGVADTEANKLIEVVYEANMQRLARRPRSTPLRCLVSEKLGLVPLRDWPTALAEYVAK
ncbi:MAG: dTDP-4-dehydrorhamnose reductase [Pyrinomonadaceae bacterium]|nr:dTDP-4-dehydrorhamnose reductase [Pyrinomonadaceae bacterium]